jgi:type I restriction enzyme, R subunit
MTTSERHLEEELVRKLVGLKYEYRSDIRDRAKLESNFLEKFQELNRVHLSASLELPVDQADKDS